MWDVRISRRRLRALLYTALLCLAITTWVLFHHERSKDHYLSRDLVEHTSDLPLTGQVRLPDGAIEPTCRANGFQPLRPSTTKRKVYDLIMMSTELDWLEIRLHTLSKYVDYFVIIESPTTFTSRTKPLYLKENWSRFAAFHHKIIYRVVEDPIQSPRIWDHEDYLRDALFKSVFPTLTIPEQQINYGDVLLVSDMDEIPRPGALLLLRHCEIPARLILRLDFYYYSFQWRHRGPQWTHPDATVYRGPSTIMPNDLRQGLLGPGSGWTPIASFWRWWERATIHNAGWHCSSCFANLAELRLKMNSFSHQGWNLKEYRDKATLVRRVRKGEDLFGREGEVYDRVEGNGDVPPYLLGEFEREGRFRYMLDRDGEDGAFEDYESASQKDDS